MRIEEALTQTGTYTAIDTINLSPVDSDPSNPASRSFTTSLASDGEGLWYQMVFLDGGGNDSLPTFPIQNLPQREPYATVSELALLLRVDANQRHAALHRALVAAADEIDSEIGTADIFGVTLPYGNPPALVRTVNLDRAVEHWKQTQAPFGIIGLGDGIQTYTARDSWDRHAHKLAVLKASWGVA